MLVVSAFTHSWITHPIAGAPNNVLRKGGLQEANDTDNFTSILCEIKGGVRGLPKGEFNINILCEIKGGVRGLPPRDRESGDTYEFLGGLHAQIQGKARISH